MQNAVIQVLVYSIALNIILGMMIKVLWARLAKAEEKIRNAKKALGVVEKKPEPPKDPRARYKLKLQ